MIIGDILDPIQHFIAWTNRKIAIHFQNRSEFYFYEREIWWASLGENVGFEMNGKNWHFERPVLIVKKFSKDMVFVFPTTTKMKRGSWFYDIEYGGTKTQVVFAQARTISTKRLIRKMALLSEGQFHDFTHSFTELIKTNSPT